MCTLYWNWKSIFVYLFWFYKLVYGKKNLQIQSLHLLKVKEKFFKTVYKYFLGDLIMNNKSVKKFFLNLCSW